MSYSNRRSWIEKKLTGLVLLALGGTLAAGTCGQIEKRVFDRGFGDVYRALTDSETDSQNYAQDKRRNY